VSVEGRCIAVGISYLDNFSWPINFGSTFCVTGKLGRVRDERRRGDGLGIHPLAMWKIQSKHFLHELLHCVSASYTFSPSTFSLFEVKVWDFGTSWSNLLLYFSGMKGGRKAVILDIKALNIWDKRGV
jgi:hypothetical protein